MSNDLIEVDALNIGGMFLWVTSHVWFPSSIHEVVTWAIGTLVGVSLLTLNLMLLNSVTSTDYTGTEVRAYNCQRLIPASISPSFTTRVISLPVT